MNKMLTIYRMTIETLTPVHIGTGTTLLRDYDFVVFDNRTTHRLNVDRVLDYLWPEDVDAMSPAEKDKLLRTPPGQLLKPEDLRTHPELVLYTMAGVPQVKGADAGQIREQIKDAFGRLYIPGSTMKGAIRTALARYLVGKMQLKPLSLVQGRPRRESADDALDARLFRPQTDSANYDLLRALRIADSEPIGTVPILANVRVFRGTKGQSPIEVEAIPAGAVFQTELILDEYLLQGQAGKLGWDNECVQAVHYFWITCRNMAVRQIQKEKEFCTANGMSALADWYERRLHELKQMKMKDTRECLLRIGWAGGWESKTLGSEILAADAKEFRQLRESFGLGRPPGRKGDWTPSKEFPLSRRLVVNAQGNPVAPMGWVLVRLEKEG
jgi:CRISPR-associated protein Csm5